MLHTRYMAIGLIMGAVALGAGCASHTPSEQHRTSGQTVDDSALVAKVKSALVKNPTTKARQVDVTAYNGEVILAGFVDTPEEKAEAGRVAKDVAGSAKVRNDLIVKAGERTAGQAVDDTVITAKVKAALIADARTKAYQIEVKTNSGVVQLAGFVDDTTAKRAASEVAETVSGVRSVRNDLEVKS